jgi:hypothetical protein
MMDAYGMYTEINGGNTVRYDKKERKREGGSEDEGEEGEEEGGEEESIYSLSLPS